MAGYNRHVERVAWALWCWPIQIDKSVNHRCRRARSHSRQVTAVATACLCPVVSAIYAYQLITQLLREHAVSAIYVILLITYFRAIRWPAQWPVVVGYNWHVERLDGLCGVGQYK